MPNDVRTTTRAKRDMHRVYNWYRKNASQREADRWYNGIMRSLDQLKRDPDRFSVIHEDDEFGVEFREMLYGSGRRKTHRVIFAIRPDAVIVHAVRHFAQDDLTLDDLQ